MPTLDALPFIDYWGWRRIDGTINKDSVGGGLVGIIIAAPLLRLAAFTSAFARQHLGWMGAQIGWFVGWLGSVIIALVLIANWKSLDEEAN